MLRLEHKGLSREGGGGALDVHQVLHQSWSDMALRALGTTDNTDDLNVVWLHVGHVNFTTWNFAILSLSEDGEERADGCVRLVVGQPCKALDSLAFFSGAIDFSLSWDVTVYHLVSDDRVLTLPEMVPNWVLVKELKSIPSACFWQG